MNNAGLSDVAVGLNCTRCDQPITVDYIAHGEGSTSDLTNDAMLDVVKAAYRMMIEKHGVQQLCRACFAADEKP
jgi:hypothetical protein